MLRFTDRPVRLCDGLSRREWLRVGGSSALGLSMAGLTNSRARAAAQPAEAGASFGRAKRCIIVFLLGGPPQHETWDPKPDAPAEVRGDLGPIGSATPGLRVGELMPRTAALTDHIAVLRAMSTYDSAHSSSGYWMLTGRPHSPTNTENAPVGAPNNWPCLAAVVKHMRPDQNGLPAAVRLPEEIWNTGRLPWPGQNAGFLGKSSDPWLLNCQPHQPGFEVPELSLPEELPAVRIDGRRSLLDLVDSRLADAQRGAPGARWDIATQQAFDLLASNGGRAAFDLDAEPPHLRERYGINRFGQSMLLARRLVESGVSIVQVNWTRWETDTAQSPAWDTHANNAHLLRTSLMPPMDLAYSALLEDLEQRGLLEETLVVWMGEFGRGPRINAAAGRDHWGPVFSVALAGGGIRGGVVHGSSDALGGHPGSGKVEPQDLAATIFHCMGIPAEAELRDPLGRPFVASNGHVIREVL